MLTTRFTELVDCSVPLQLAGFAPPLLAAAVCEAGGHVRGTIGRLPLLDQVLPAVSVPVLAAGGIGSGRAMAAALAAGADGVRVGTRFLGAAEFPTHPVYLDGLVRAQAQDTVYT